MVNTQFLFVKSAYNPIIYRMKKCPIVLSALLVSFLLFSTYSLKGQQYCYNYKIVIDPGHGGTDGGKLCSGGLEKDFTLQTADFLVAELLVRGFNPDNIILTRTSDTFVELEDRARIAIDNKADIFVQYTLQLLCSRRTTRICTRHRNLHPRRKDR